MTRYKARLRREAEVSARWRGHTLAWRGIDLHRSIGTCTRDGCTASVNIDDHPAPNGIDIGGEAVALNHPVLTGTEDR